MATQPRYLLRAAVGRTAIQSENEPSVTPMYILRLQQAATTRALPCENVDLKDAYIQVPLDETETPICKLAPNHTSYVPQPPGDAARRQK